MEKSELIISGIVCDNPKCDYDNPTVPFKDYPMFINKPCPYCSQVLLTEKEYNKCVKMMNAVKKLNEIEKYFSFTFWKEKIKSIFKNKK